MVGAFVLLLGVLHVSSAPAAPLYTITELNVSSEQGLVLGDMGTVGGSQFIDGRWRAVTWDSGVVSPVGAPEQEAFSVTGINSNGVITGTAGYVGGLGRATPYVVDELGFRYLPIPGGSAESTGISDNGLVAGFGFYAPNQRPTQRALVWTSAGPIEVADLGYSASVAYGVNDAGTVVGYVQEAGTVATLPFRTQNGIFTELESPLVGGYAKAINQHGWIVGVSGVSAPGACAGSQKAVLWIPDASPNILEPLSGYSCSDARAINDEGYVVGYSTNQTSVAERATLWTPEGAAVDLLPLVANSAGWELGIALDINSLGQIIGAGSIWSDGGPRSATFLLTPIPIPGAAWLFLGALGLLSAMGRMR